MSRLSAILGVLLALGCSAAGAETLWASPSAASALCQAGPRGDHPAGSDTDGDGVPDSADWCVTTPRGARVGSNGCAVWEVDVECAQSVPPEPSARVVPAVAEAAQPSRVIDSDGDSVPDSEDRCPGTPKGVLVDKYGCALIEKVVLKGVNFATGSAGLLPAASVPLKSVAAAMKANPKLEVEIGGFTDNVGNEAKNQKLSERRAGFVKDFLVKEGIEASRLTIRGYGKNNPADTNDTREGRGNNRRVAFKVTKS